VNERSGVTPPSLLRVARVFAVLGTTSFGGGVVAYLRDALVEKERWFDDKEFVRLLELSQTLPGLNAVNLAVIAGDQLRGGRGAAVAGLAMLLPGVAFVLGLGALYAPYANAGWMTALLGGAAAAAVGLLLATALRLGRAQFRRPLDLAILVVTAIAVGELRLPLVWVVPVVGVVAVWLYRPRPGATGTQDAQDVGTPP
jgi:chromate transporter